MPSSGIHGETQIYSDEQLPIQPLRGDNPGCAHVVTSCYALIATQILDSCPLGLRIDPKDSETMLG